MNDKKNPNADLNLDILLAEYRKPMPSDLQMQKWKNAIRTDPKSILANVGAVYDKTSKSAASPGIGSQKQIWLQLIAATVVGFIVGALFFKNLPSDHSRPEQNYADDATIEYVVTKIE